MVGTPGSVRRVTSLREGEYDDLLLGKGATSFNAPTGNSTQRRGPVSHIRVSIVASDV